LRQHLCRHPFFRNINMTRGIKNDYEYEYEDDDEDDVEGRCSYSYSSSFSMGHFETASNNCHTS
jgi:hypothetical protein